MSFSVWYVNISRHAVVQKKYVSTDHSRNSSSVEFGIFVLFQQVGSLRAPGLCRRVQGSVTSAAFDPISQYFLHKKMFSSFSCSVPSPTFLWVLPGVSFFFLILFSSSSWFELSYFLFCVCPFSEEPQESNTPEHKRKADKNPQK